MHYEHSIGVVTGAAPGLGLATARRLLAKGRQGVIAALPSAPGAAVAAVAAHPPEPVKASLGAAVPQPPRLGQADELAALALQILDNPMRNGETIRLDGTLRRAPR